MRKSGDGGSFRFKSGVELINVTATVTDASGRFVPGLRKEDFRVYEDGEPQTVTHFNAERTPVSLGIVLDRLAVLTHGPFDALAVEGVNHRRPERLAVMPLGLPLRRFLDVEARRGGLRGGYRARLPGHLRHAQGAAADRQAPATLRSTDLAGLRLRGIGPATMSGRFVDMDVVESNPYTMYVASATGGLWRTTDNGITWTPVFEREAVHSIGDAAVRASLDAFEAARGNAVPFPHRIEHIEIVHPSDVPRFKELSVVASMQPNHGTNSIGYVPTRVGSHRTNRAYVWRSLLTMGIPLVFEAITAPGLRCFSTSAKSLCFNARRATKARSLTVSTSWMTTRASGRPVAASATASTSSASPTGPRTASTARCWSPATRPVASKAPASRWRTSRPTDRRS